jgi:FkbH-like protein
MLSDRPAPMEYNKLLAESRKLKTPPAKPVIRLALLSDAATQQFVPLLRVLIDHAGFAAEIYEGPFDGIQFEAFDSASGLYAFNPDAIVILNSTQALRISFSNRNGSAEEFVRDTLAKITGVWEAILGRCRATVLQSTYVLPLERTFGNLDRKVSESFYSVAIQLNARIAEASRAKSGVLLHDVDCVASLLGRSQFFDDRFWDMWKTFCAAEFLAHVAQNIVDVLMAMRGRIAKCVVLDLDNTLWGGVIGDDGLDGIRISAHGEGEAWYRLQLYLRELLRRGILLAVCSKNDEKNALLPFESHPDMVLRRSDISVFKANWKDKAENIREIQQILNIGFDSMVFLDDNGFERNLVRELVPGIIVPELPDDSSEYVKFLSELNLFETNTFSVEDLRRAEMYREEAERHAEAGSYASVEEFLESLDMRIVVARFDSFHLPRISQLTQRSNQFNLTTIRRSEAECEQMIHDESVEPLYVKLSDRLGDHGLISVVIVRPEGGALNITDWLMSCRVLQRGVEQYVMNEVFAIAAERGLSQVTGRYSATAKNGMVKDFFSNFGFICVTSEDGETRWSRQVESYIPYPTFLKPAKPELMTAGSIAG